MKPKKKKNQCCIRREWLAREFDIHDPHDAQVHVRGMLKSEAECSEIFKIIAGLSVIAAVYGDKDGQNACCDALHVLSNAKHSVHTMKDSDFTGPESDTIHDN